MPKFTTLAAMSRFGPSVDLFSVPQLWTLQFMDTFQHVQSLLCEIEDAMRRDGENNWIRGIRWAIERMEAAGPDLSEVSQVEALSAVRSIYGSMFGPGKFDDYIFGRDPELHSQAAKRFEALKAELWDILASLS